jgi:hypothetical protein
MAPTGATNNVGSGYSANNFGGAATFYLTKDQGDNCKRHG